MIDMNENVVVVFIVDDDFGLGAIFLLACLFKRKMIEKYCLPIIIDYYAID